MLRAVPLYLCASSSWQVLYFLKIIITYACVLQFLPPSAPEVLVSRGGFGSPTTRRLAHITRPLLTGACFSSRFPRRCCTRLIVFTIGANGLAREFSWNFIVNAIGCAASWSGHTSCVSLAFAVPRGPLPSLHFLRAWSRPGREAAAEKVSEYTQHYIPYVLKTYITPPIHSGSHMLTTYQQ